MDFFCVKRFFFCGHLSLKKKTFRENLCLMWKSKNHKRVNKLNGERELTKKELQQEREWLVSQSRLCVEKSFLLLSKGKLIVGFLIWLESGSFILSHAYDLHLFYYLHFVNKISLWRFYQWKIQFGKRKVSVKYTHKFYEVLEVSLFSSFSQKHTGQLFHIALAFLLLNRGGLIFAWKHFKSMSYSLTVPSVCLISWLWSSSIHKIAYYFRPFNIRWTKKKHIG